MDTKKLIFKNTYSSLPLGFYTYEKERNFDKAELFLFNENLVKDLALDEFFTKLSNEEKAKILSASEFMEGTRPLSQAYAGHQFGYFNILGDGRALLLTEIENANNELYDIHLKGSGATVYSRGGDGRASLEAMLREYIISEAMYALNIPSTRSLAIVKTGDKIYREKVSDAAILARVAKSHIRVGTFSYARRLGVDNVKALADYTIKRHYMSVENEPDKYRKFLALVIEKQAELISKWVLNAFIHGVMNTDNMLISGETIDYGPCAFMDVYNPDTVFSSIDRNGRYRYSNQKDMGLWNLSRFAESLLPLLSSVEEEAIAIAKEELQKYKGLFDKYFYEGMAKKLGFKDISLDIKALVDELLLLMYINKADYTNTFVRLALELENIDASYLDLTKNLFAAKEFINWKNAWLKKLEDNNISKEEANKMMKRNNPFVIPRNQMIENALSLAGKGDMNYFNDYLKILQNPFEYNLDNKNYQKVNEDFSKTYNTYCGT